MVGCSRRELVPGAAGGPNPRLSMELGGGDVLARVERKGGDSGLSVECLCAV